MEEQLEIPVQRQMFRQSSYETHLLPASDTEDDDENSNQPKVIHAVLKSPIPTNQSTVSFLQEFKEAANYPPDKESTASIKQEFEEATNYAQDEENNSKAGCEEPEDKNVVVNDDYDDKTNTAPLRGLPIPLKQQQPKMASPRPKSPRPISGKNDKEESFWDKIGTLGRKKRIKEVQEVQLEGKYAIDSPGSPNAPEIPPEEYALADNEERSIVDPRAFDEPKLRELVLVLIDWINDELAEQRIIVKNLDEDLYDGQVLQKLLEKLTGDKLDVPEVTQSEEGQRQKLSVVLATVNKILGLQRYHSHKWSVESVHTKSIVAILHLLVALARHFRAPIRLPEHVSVELVVVQKAGNQLTHRIETENITAAYDDVGMRCEKDAFDTLFEQAADKLHVVKKSLVTFVNKHLNKINLEVTEIDTQFHDGVYLTLLMGLLEGFFVPLYSFHLTPQDFDQKVHNVAFAFELMEEVGLPKPKARPEDIVNLDLKSTLRVLYNLFSKYKNKT